MVSEKQCDERHGRLSRRFKAIYGAITIAIIAIGWAVTAGHLAQKKATAVENKLVTHEAVQVKTEQHRDETLDRIETMVKDLHAREPP